MTEPSQWEQITSRDPNHSSWYIERFRDMARNGDDLAGEARFIHAISPRDARVLDAGCGPGRVGAGLAALGHEVVGVDVDPVLIAAAEEDHPGPTWLVGDLAELDLPARGVSEGFDAIVCAGNVMTFLAPSTRREVLTRLGNHLRPNGRIAIGFGAGRDYEFADFHEDVAAAGLVVDLRLSAWDIRAFDDESDFIVALLSRET